MIYYQYILTYYVYRFVLDYIVIADKIIDNIIFIFLTKDIFMKFIDFMKWIFVPTSEQNLENKQRLSDIFYNSIKDISWLTIIYAKAIKSIGMLHNNIYSNYIIWFDTKSILIILPYDNKSITIGIPIYISKDNLKDADVNSFWQNYDIELKNNEIISFALPISIGNIDTIINKNQFAIDQEQEVETFKIFFKNYFVI